MSFNLALAYAQFLSRLLLNATCILSISLIVSVNLIGSKWSEDDIKWSVCVFLCYFAPS